MTQYRELSGEWVDAWLGAGFPARDFFPHRAYSLHKAAPDGYKLAGRSGLDPRPEQMWEVVVFALPAAIDGLPRGLFFDDEIMWHRQQFGLPGQVAVAGVLVQGTVMYTAAHHSDVVQRISRRREHKTRVETLLRGWDRMLLNGILAFALERGITTVHVPTAASSRAQTDAARAVGPELFDRVYDRHVCDNYDVTPHGAWWVIDIAANRHRIVQGRTRHEATTPRKSICVCHDIEAGLGHRQEEPEFARTADAGAAVNLAAMLEVERALGITATYNVVGTMLPDLRDGLEASGHCIGFHTFDHHIEARGFRARSLLARRLRVGRVPDGTPTRLQLGRCRALDYRIKGYRPAQSRLGADTDEGSMARQNFEWLASSTRSLGFATPRLERGIVKVPIRFDDFALHQGMPYDDWEAQALARVEQAKDFLALSLHDCYGPAWLDRYPSFLGQLADMAEMQTLDQVAAEVTLADAG